MGQDIPETEAEYSAMIEDAADMEIEAAGDSDGDVWEMAFTAADTHDLIHGGLSGHVAILEQSGQGPGEWKHLVSDEMSWREVVQALAFRALQNDIAREIQRRLDR